MKKLTFKQIITYLINIGYNKDSENFNDIIKWAIEEQNKPRGHQFIEAVNDDMALCDYNRWQYIQDILFGSSNEMISSDGAFKIIDILEEEGIEILEINR